MILSPEFADAEARRTGGAPTPSKMGLSPIPWIVLCCATFLLSGGELSAQDFGTTRALNQDYLFDTRSDQSPHIVTDGRGVWVAAWSSSESNDFDPLFVRSVDRAETWSAIDFLNPSEEGGINDMDEYRVRIANGGSDTWIAVWQHGEFSPIAGRPDFEIRYVRSTDRGITWSMPAFLNQDAATDTTKFDTFPSLATDGAGHWVAVWKADRPGVPLEQDILVARSIDDGVTWTSPVALSTDLPLGAAADFDPTIETNGNGTWITVWRALALADLTTLELLYSRSTDSGATWSASSTLLSEALIDGAGESGRPLLATDAGGNWIAMWERDVASSSLSRRPYYSRTTDDGLSWSVAEELAPHATSYSGRDYIGIDSIATNGAGEWRAMWSSVRTNGVDRVPVYAVSNDVGATWSTATVAMDPAGTTAAYAGSLVHDGNATWAATADAVFFGDSDVFIATASSALVPALNFWGAALLIASVVGAGSWLRHKGVKIPSGR